MSKFKSRAADRPIAFTIDDVDYAVPPSGVVAIPDEYDYIPAARGLQLDPADAEAEVTASVTVRVPPHVETLLAKVRPGEAAAFRREWARSDEGGRARLERELRDHLSRAAADAQRKAEEAALAKELDEEDANAPPEDGAPAEADAVADQLAEAAAVMKRRPRAKTPN